MKICYCALMWCWWATSCTRGAAAWRARTPVLQTRQGLLRGLRSVSGQNHYYGIPYAVSERFKPPREAHKWSGVYDAVQRLGSCPQMLFNVVVGREECLELDVHSPAATRGRSPGHALGLPVMLFVHGGAYYYGTKAYYDPEYLVAKNVVVVVANYRLNVLGFLCLNGVSNLGLWDQVAALKWVKENIRAFGGDPDNVTLCGQSAGASAVTMHLMSPASKGLFHKAIAMSGSVFAPWAFNLEPEVVARDDARKIAPQRPLTERDIYEVFLNSSIRDLIRATRDTSVDPRHFKYSPCLDLNSTEPFFTGTPYDIFIRGEFTKVPMMISRTEEEGTLFYGLADAEILEKFNERFDERLPSVFSWCPGNRKPVGALLRSHYFGDRNITKNLRENLIRFYSDWIVDSTHDDFVELLTAATHEPVYSYEFSYRGDRNFAGLLSGVRPDRTTHSDDIFYLFKPAGLPLPLSARDRLFIDSMTRMLANFMKFGEPKLSGGALPPVRWSRPELARAHAGGGALRDALCAYGRAGHAPCAPAALCRSSHAPSSSSSVHPVKLR